MVDSENSEDAEFERNKLPKGMSGDSGSDSDLDILIQVAALVTRPRMLSVNSIPAEQIC